ncbi:hypothetical protein BaRGS_00035025 [Batillaria attramentaria]|uniref:Uncharacterized protein n=1 Tax=Batillaria attramentaria TaxID=370345 RepID=A0ABD0JFT0_9CAEN
MPSVTLIPLVLPKTDQLGQLVKTLVEAKASPNDADNEGRTPLHLACRKGDCHRLIFCCKPVLTQSFLRKEAKRKLEILKARTPLHLACQNGRQEIVQILLGTSAGVDARDNEGYTPLSHCK